MDSLQLLCTCYTCIKEKTQNQSKKAKQRFCVALLLRCLAFALPVFDNATQRKRCVALEGHHRIDMLIPRIPLLGVLELNR